jgi:hypothetical protein
MGVCKYERALVNACLFKRRKYTGTLEKAWDGEYEGAFAGIVRAVLGSD